MFYSNSYVYSGLIYKKLDLKARHVVITDGLMIELKGVGRYIQTNKRTTVHQMAENMNEEVTLVVSESTLH